MHGPGNILAIRRYAAPAAFLLAATIAVVLIRSGIDTGQDRAATVSRPAATTRAVTKRPARTRHRTRYWTVRAGDTLGSIAARTHVTVAVLRRLNPKVSPTSLYIGEKIRLE